MKALSIKPSFAEGALVALCLSVLGSFAYISLSLFFISAVAAAFVLIIVGGAYLFYLIKRSHGKGGKLLATLTVSTVMLLCALLPLSLTSMLLVFVTGVWVLRSLYFRQGFLDRVFDLLLNFLSLGAAATALIVSKSEFLAIWTFFIVQATHVYLPSLTEQKLRTGTQASDGFRRAYEDAQSTLKRMHKPTVQ